MWRESENRLYPSCIVCCEKGEREGETRGRRKEGRERKRERKRERGGGGERELETVEERESE